MERSATVRGLRSSRSFSTWSSVTVVGRVRVPPWAESPVARPPAVTVALRLLFASSVVVLEGFWAIEALKRSRALAKGLNWRNLAVLILIWVIVVVLLALASTVFTLLHVKSAFAGRMFTVGMAMIVVPVFFIAVVLLYYDSRVRKEAYDNSALAEDLRR